MRKKPTYKSSRAGHKSLFKKRQVLIASLVFVILIAGLSIALWHRHSNQKVAVVTPATSSSRPTNSVDYSPAKPSDNTATNQSKGSSPAAATPPADNSSPGVSITMQGANAEPHNGIMVSALVQGVTSGTCTFNFSRSDGGSIQESYSEAVQLSVNYYDCPSYTVNMPSNGSWYVSAVLTSGSQTATSKWAANPVTL